MMDEKLSRRERNKLKHRSEILATALDLFSEKGYHNVSMHEIAERAEFAVGTLYMFFKNKEELYKALIMENAVEYHRILNGVLSKENDILTIIEEYISTKTRIFAESIATLRLYFGETHGVSFNIKAGLDQDIRKLYDELVERLSSVLEKGIRENVLRDVNPYYLAVGLEGITNAFVFCWLEDPDRHPYKANVPLITELFLRGCLAK
jgi:AcrR family transcriptional regulator